MFGSDRYHARRPPLGQALAVLAVNEEQKRKTLHTHAVAWTDVPPAMLQLLAGRTYLETLVHRAINSMYKTEIPAPLHLQSTMCYEIGSADKPRMARETPPICPPIDTATQTIEEQQSIRFEHAKALRRFAQTVAMTTNIHGHVTPGTCDPKNKPPPHLEMKCRLGKGSPMQDNNDVIQLAEVEDSQDRDAFEIVPLQPPPRGLLPKDRVPGTGLPEEDNRALVYVLPRRQIDTAFDGVTTPSSTPSPDINIINMTTMQLEKLRLNFHDELLTGEDTSAWADAIIADLDEENDYYWRLTETEKTQIRQLPRHHIEKMKTVLENRQALVVDYSIAASCALRCNTAVYMLGSSGQSIAVFFYLVKYIAKDAHDLGHSMASIAAAKEHIATYPTAPLPGETPQLRNMKHWMNRIVNSSDGGVQEKPCTTVGHANMGGTGHLVTDGYPYVFAHDMVNTTAKIIDPQQHAPVEDEDNELGTLPVYTTRSGLKVPISQAEMYLHRVHPQYQASWERIITEASRKLEECDNNPSLRDQVDIRQKAVDLAWSGYYNNLTHLNIREFAAIIQIEPMSPDEYQTMVDLMEHPESVVRSEARQQSMRFLFDPDFALHESHRMVVGAKQGVVVTYGGKPPPYPTTTTASPSPALQKKRNQFARFAMATFLPIDRTCHSFVIPAGLDRRQGIPLGDPIELTYDWAGFCRWLDYALSPFASFMDRGRVREIRNFAFATREHPDFGQTTKKLVTRYR